MNPERIGTYQILEKIGSGGMGSVYLGREVETGRVAAIKVLTASLARENGFVERFNREIDAMTKLQNPHIVTLYGSGAEGENYYYAMEYVPGETLLSLMRREKRLSWRRTFEIAADVCQALKAAHDAGIIHRDLKPSNLLVSPEGFVKLADFGVAQVFAGGKLTVTGGIIGTAEYMSPEQAQGKRAGKQSDLYSLGAVMYAMITGRTPFSGTTAIEVMQKHKYGVFDRPRSFVPDLPKRVDDTICRLLEKDPAKRFPDALVLLRHLEQTLELENYAAAGATIIAAEPRNGGQANVPTDDEPGQVAAPALGPATLMQTLMRAELASVLHGGIFSAIFNNTFVLVGLLALVIAGGVWFLRPRELTEEEMFERGKAVLNSEEGPEWIRAKREIFEKLLERDPARWGEKVEPFLQEIDAYEATRRIGRGLRTGSATPKTEPERLLQMAQYHRQEGDFHRAERILEALNALLAGDEQQAKLHDVVVKALAEVRQQIETAAGREELLSSALDRAAKLAQEGKIDEAAKIWGGIVELYKDDPSVREFVRQAEEGLSRQASP